MTIYFDKFTTGLQSDRQGPFLNEDAFYTLKNAYPYRKKVLRKRGSTLLGRLRRDFTGLSLGNTGASPWSFNIYTTITPAASFETNAQIVPGSVIITFAGPVVFTDQGDGTLSGSVGGNSGTIDYTSGDIVLTHTSGAGVAVTVDFGYFPTLPVMGLETFRQQTNPPVLVSFDTSYSYLINQSTNTFYDVNFYQKTAEHFTWTGENYQQFYSERFQNALWVTNGKPGFHFESISSTTNVSGVTSFDFTITDATLAVGDRVFFNEVAGGSVTDLNGQTGTITAIGAAPTYTVSVDQPVSLNAVTSGIVQFLTHSVSTAGQDGIRYFNGDPIGDTDKGWVNFAPPLSNSGLTGGSPDYLVGAKIIQAFKDRLLFFGIYQQTSSGSVEFYPNRMAYSQNGTVYYTSLVPIVQENPSADAWYQNIPAKGGRLDAPVQQQIKTVNENEDVLICGFTGSHRKLISTGDDSFPFYYQTINSELGAQYTFSGINLDQGSLNAGLYGFQITTQTKSQRIDLQIPDEIFNVAISNNDSERFTSVRDKTTEFVYFTFKKKNSKESVFPNQTLFYNYRENNWAIFDENYTHYGIFERNTGYTWATLPFRTWSQWLNPWNYGGIGARFPFIVGGNQQGFVLIKNEEIKEGISNYVSAISTNTITSPNHNMNEGDWIQFSGLTGTSSSELNGTTTKILTVSDADTFTIDITVTGTYTGGGTFRRISKPEIRTKMFSNLWANGKRTRIGPFDMLLKNSGGTNGQITVQLYTNQSDTVSTNTQTSSYHPFTNIILTSPNPNVPGQEDQSYIWHRYNNVLKGDSIQVGLTLSDEQMNNPSINEKEIELDALIIQLRPAGIL